MAKKTESDARVSKADLIREELKKDIDAPANDVIEAIVKKHGEEARPQTSAVSNLRKQIKEGVEVGKRGRKPGTTVTKKAASGTKTKRATKSTESGLTLATAKRLASVVRDDFGGDLEKAKAALDELAEVAV